MASQRGISLLRYEQERVFIPSVGQAVRLVIDAVDAYLMPAEVFGHQKTLLDAYTTSQKDEFMFVCSPFDLVTYPANEPDPDQFPAFFRKSRIVAIMPSQSRAERLWDDVHEEVCELVRALNRLDRLRLREQVRCGSELPEVSASFLSAVSSLGG